MRHGHGRWVVPKLTPKRPCRAVPKARHVHLWGRVVLGTPRLCLGWTMPEPCWVRSGYHRYLWRLELESSNLEHKWTPIVKALSNPSSFFYFLISKSHSLKLNFIEHGRCFQVKILTFSYGVVSLGPLTKTFVEIGAVCFKSKAWEELLRITCQNIKVRTPNNLPSKGCPQ